MYNKYDFNKKIKDLYKKTKRRNEIRDMYVLNNDFNDDFMRKKIKESIKKVRKDEYKNFESIRQSLEYKRKVTETRRREDKVRILNKNKENISFKTFNFIMSNHENLDELNKFEYYSVREIAEVCFYCSNKKLFNNLFLKNIKILAKKYKFKDDDIIF